MKALLRGVHVYLELHSLSMIATASNKDSERLTRKVPKQIFKIARRKDFHQVKVWSAFAAEEVERCFQIDTCCIDRISSAELSEATSSM